MAKSCCTCRVVYADAATRCPRCGGTSASRLVPRARLPETRATPGPETTAFVVSCLCAAVGAAVGWQVGAGSGAQTGGVLGFGLAFVVLAGGVYGEA